MTILKSDKIDLKNRSIILPTLGKTAFDAEGLLLVEDDNVALQLIEDTAGSIDLIDIGSIKNKVLDDDLNPNKGEEDDEINLSPEERLAALTAKIGAVNFKELKLLAAELVKGVEGIKYSDWANLRKEDLQKYLIALIAPAPAEEVVPPVEPAKVEEPTAPEVK